MKRMKYTMKHLLTSFFLFISTISSVSAQTAPQRSVEAEHLLQCLKSIEGKETLSGTMANVNWNLNEAKWVHQHTGKWPALNGFDYIHHPFSSKGGWIDYTNINEVASWNSQGGVVCIMFNSSILKSSLSVPQTALVSRLKIDSIVVIMKLKIIIVLRN